MIIDYNKMTLNDAAKLVLEEYEKENSGYIKNRFLVPKKKKYETHTSITIQINVEVLKFINDVCFQKKLKKNAFWEYSLINGLKNIDFNKLNEDV
jgi:uncharacterized membrane protein YukC